MQQYLEYYGVFAEERVKDYVADILEVLGQVHALGIVHRDITAGNIMISDDGIVKLIDFGIAREVKKEQGKDTVVLGTVGYAAPEQFGFHQSDARTDLYAVGVLCNEMLTGKLPGDGLYNGSQNMQKIILKATVIDAKQRFQTADKKSIRFPECLWQQKSFWNWCLALYFSWEGMQLRTICAWMSCIFWENK